MKVWTSIIIIGADKCYELIIILKNSWKQSFFSVEA